jgi:hypothetical protein
MVALVEWPSTGDPAGALGEVKKLARRLGFELGGKFLAELEHHRMRMRELYVRLMARERER